METLQNSCAAKKGRRAKLRDYTNSLNAFFPSFRIYSATLRLFAVFKTFSVMISWFLDFSTHKLGMVAYLDTMNSLFKLLTTSVAALFRTKAKMCLRHQASFFIYYRFWFSRNANALIDCLCAHKDFSTYLTFSRAPKHVVKVVQRSSQSSKQKYLTIDTVPQLAHSER